MAEMDSWVPRSPEVPTDERSDAFCADELSRDPSLICKEEETVDAVIIKRQKETTLTLHHWSVLGHIFEHASPNHAKTQL